MEFFAGNSTRAYFETVSQKLASEVEQIGDSEITTCNFQEWAAYLCSKYEIVSITLFEENIEQSLKEVKVKRYNQFYRSVPYEPEYFEVDGVCISFKIPFDGDERLFQLQPRRMLMTHYSAKNFCAPRGSVCGSFTLEFEYTKQELQDKAEKMQQYVKSELESTLGNYRTMVGYVNLEVKEFNAGLEKFALKCLEERKKKADSLSLINQMLEIPLIRSDRSPNTTPIPLERIARVPAKKPDSIPTPNEFSIKDSDYENINNIILICGTTMEKTARTYYRNTEEELRDHLLAALNTHYENATGETFRKIGKTDINIEFDNKAAFVGECKIWHGEKMLDETIRQVLNYCTWKDIKVSVIIFNKENQNFQAVVEKIDKWVNVYAKSYSKKRVNAWECKYFRLDMGIEIKLNILVFDLYVDKTKFQDSRDKN